MDSEYIISETIDFDKTIKKVLEFAKKDENTLVLITADHETGGYSIIDGDIEENIIGDPIYNNIKTDFINDDHTATMVPIFSFGPNAQHFIGTYHNTELYNKILSGFNIKN